MGAGAIEADEGSEFRGGLLHGKERIRLSGSIIPEANAEKLKEDK